MTKGEGGTVGVERRTPDQPRLSVAIVGLGAIGGVIAGCLRSADLHNVVVCVRRPITRFILEHAEKVIEMPMRALCDPSEAAPVDWVLLCTKAHQTPSAAPWLKKLCGAQTRIAVLQNGIGHVQRVTPFAPTATIVPAIVYYNGERIADDRARLRRVSNHDIAVRDDADGQAFVSLLTGTPLSVLASLDFDTLAWRKLLINAIANPITALTLQRQAVLRREDIQALCLTVLDEAIAVGRADGACLADDEAAQTMATLLTYPAEAGTSMYFDRLAGRPFEIEALTGAIVAAGARHGIATPLNQAFLTLLRASSDASRPPHSSR